MGHVTIVGSYITALVMDTDVIPLEGQTVFGHNFHTTHGGKGSNMAVAAARLGAAVDFVGKIGRDHYGESCLELLQREQVTTRGIMYSETSPTASGIILFSSRGTNAIVIDRGANGEMEPADVASQGAMIGKNDVVVSPLEIPYATARAAAELARQRGGKAILNPAPAEDLRDKDLTTFFALTPNETEARVCLGLAPDDPSHNEKLASSLLALGAEHVVITLGPEGALWACAKGLQRIAALRVDPIDAIGAGDAFNAGLAVGLSEGWSMHDAICLGVTTASLSTEKRETIESYPYRAEVNARLAEVRSVSR